MLFSVQLGDVFDGRQSAGAQQIRSQLSQLFNKIVPVRRSTEADSNW